MKLKMKILIMTILVGLFSCYRVRSTSGVENDKKIPASNHNVSEDICSKKLKNQKESILNLLNKHFSKKIISGIDSSIVYADNNGIGIHWFMSSPDDDSFIIRSLFDYDKSKFEFLKQYELFFSFIYPNSDDKEDIKFINPLCPLYNSYSDIPDSVLSISFNRESSFYCQSPEIDIVMFRDDIGDVKITTKTGNEYIYFIPLHGGDPELKEIRTKSN